MTTMELIEKGIGHNCLSDAYELGRADGYNQALEDMKKYILNSCNDVICREDINADNDFDFYASELLDMLEEMNK